MDDKLQYVDQRVLDFMKTCKEERKMAVYNFFRNYSDAVKYTIENGGIVKLLVTHDGVVTRDGVKLIKMGYDLGDMYIFRFAVVNKIK